MKEDDAHKIHLKKKNFLRWSNFMETITVILIKKNFDVTGEKLAWSAVAKRNFITVK